MNASANGSADTSVDTSAAARIVTVSIVRGGDGSVGLRFHRRAHATSGPFEVFSYWILKR